MSKTSEMTLCHLNYTRGEQTLHLPHRIFLSVVPLYQPRAFNVVHMYAHKVTKLNDVHTRANFPS